MMTPTVERDEAYESRCKVFRVSPNLICSLAAMMGSKNETWCLPAWPEMPLDAWVRGVYYSAMYDRLEFIVHSASFPITPEGCAYEGVDIPNYTATTKAFPNPYL